MQTQRIVVLRSYALIVETDRILLCRLSGSSDNPGMWTLPGGGGDFGESPQETCRREVREETGLEVVLDPRSWTDSRVWVNPGHENHTVRFYFRAASWSGELAIEKLGSTDLPAWIPLDEVPALLRADVIDFALRVIEEDPSFG
jgi:8-oxo-dGTP diphosphatase